MAAILLVLLYRLIFVFSGQDGEESGSLSAMISEKCAELLNAISGKHWTQNVLDSMAAYFEHPIRKLAHFLSMPAWECYCTACGDPGRREDGSCIF